MKQYRKLLAGIFAGGVLISGIGAGIGCVEFFSLDYAGERTVGETEMTVMEGEMSFTPPSDGGTVDVYMDYGQPYLNLVWDDSVPENTLHYSIEYNKKRVAPEAWQEDAETLGFYFPYINYDEVRDVMEFRNIILDDLKEHKIGSYRQKDIESIDLYLNPKDREEIEIW